VAARMHCRVPKALRARSKLACLSIGRHLKRVASRAQGSQAPRKRRSEQRACIVGLQRSTQLPRQPEGNQLRDGQRLCAGAEGVPATARRLSDKKCTAAPKVQLSCAPPAAQPAPRQAGM